MTTPGHNGAAMEPVASARVALDRQRFQPSWTAVASARRPSTTTVGVKRPRMQSAAHGDGCRAHQRDSPGDVSILASVVRAAELVPAANPEDSHQHENGGIVPRQLLGADSRNVVEEQRGEHGSRQDPTGCGSPRHGEDPDDRADDGSEHGRGHDEIDRERHRRNDEARPLHEQYFHPRHEQHGRQNAC